MNEIGPLDVEWNECEIHHVVLHSEGGPTNVSNAVLVHKDCHPKSQENVEKFRDWWSKRKGE